MRPSHAMCFVVGICAAVTVIEKSVGAAWTGGGFALLTLWVMIYETERR